MAAGPPTANHTPALAEAEHQHVLHTLIQEAQQEIGRLRAELYSTSRLADERKQALDAITAARDQLAAVAHQLEEKVQVMHSQLMQLPQLQHELKVLHEQQQQVDKDRAVQMQARRILESELQDERAGRAAAEEARAKAEADRSRLQLAQDDLAAQVRLLKQKVADAEEEQLRAEEEAAQLRQEAAMQQQQLASGALGDSGTAAGGASGASARNRDRALEEGLRTAQLEAQAAKAEAARLQQELQLAHQQAQQAQQQLQAQLHDLMQQQDQKQHQQHLHTHAAGASSHEQQLAAEVSSCRAQISNLQQALATAEAQAAAAKSEAAKATAAAAAAATAAAASAAGGASGRSGFSQQAIPAAGVGSHGGVAVVSSSSDAEAEALQEQIELLMDKVVTLKKSRDKLLEQLDGQSVEMEQLLAEHQAMSTTSDEAKQECKNWQAQAQDSLVTINRLQELLAEAAGWEGQGAAKPAGDQKHQQPPDDAGGAATIDSQEDLAKLRVSMLQQQVQVTTLELQVKVLSAQLLRSHAAYKQASSSLVPLLSGVEARLLSLKARSGGLVV